MSFTTTVSPSTNSLTTAESGTHDERITVSLPQQGTIAKIDVYFLADSTGSMTPIINAVKSGASDILNGLLAKAHEVAADLYFGVGNYRDLDPPVSNVFGHQQSLTTDTGAVVTAIRSWAVAGGRTIAEGQFYALDQLAQTPNGSIGWRGDAKRIVIWFGDAPGHDPICQAISGLSYDITEQSVTAKLTGQGIVVLVISTPTGSSGPGLNVDPIPHSRNGDYERLCGAVGGSAGQGSRIATATGGEYADQINVNTIVATILRLGGAEVGRIGNVSLVADEQIAPFVTTITPGHGHGPLAAGNPQDVDFDVSFAGVSITGGPPSTTEPVTVNGALNVRADGVTVGRKTVQITVPDLAGKYKIQSKVNGLFLQLKAPASWVGAAHVVDQGTARVGGDATSQHWELIPVPGGGYQINNMYPRGSGQGVGRFLEVPGGVAREEDDNGNLIVLITRGGPPGVNHQWRLIPVGADSEGVIYRIETFLNFDRDNYYTSYVIDASLNHGEDNPVFLFHYWGNYPTFAKNHGQHWRLLVVP